jgi:HEAT repeat protein
MDLRKIVAEQNSSPSLIPIVFCALSLALTLVLGGGSAQLTHTNVVAALDQLHSQDPKKRTDAIGQLKSVLTKDIDGTPHADEVVYGIIDALSDPDVDVQRAAALALWNYDVFAISDWNTQTRIPSLIHALTSNNPLVRRSAAQVLGVIVSSSRHRMSPLIGRSVISPIISPMIASLEDSDADVRSESVKTLRHFSQEEVADNGRKESALLAKELSERDVAVQATAAWALGSIGPEARSAVPTLILNLNSESSCTRLSAAWALGRVGAEAVKALPKLASMLHDNGNSKVGVSYASGQVHSFGASWIVLNSVHG